MFNSKSNKSQKRLFIFKEDHSPISSHPQIPFSRLILMCVLFHCLFDREISKEQEPGDFI